MTDETNPSEPKALTDTPPVEADTSRAGVSEEDAKLAEEIFAELITAPSLKCPINFTGPGDEQTVHRAIAVLQLHALLLRRKHPWLNFDALDSIVFHSDYTLALREIGERAGRPCEATSEASGIGLAMVVHLADKCVTVMDAGIALGMVDDSDEARRDLCIDTALHELCHVYDYARKRRLLGHEFLKRRLQPIEVHVFPAAEAAWCEYFANKYSNSARSSPDMHPRYLADVVPVVVNDIRAAVRSYRTHHQLDRLLEVCEQKVGFLFQCFGYAAGRLAATGARLEEVAPDSASELKKAGFWDAWCNVYLGLERLDACREEWTSFDELKPLMAVVDTAFKTLGLYYSASGDARRVDIPFTPETMPNQLASLMAQSLTDRFT